MLVSTDLDCTNTMYIQFSFKFITKGQSGFKPDICIFCCINEWMTVAVCSPFVCRSTRALSLGVAAVFSEWRNQLAAHRRVLFPDIH